jgi:hypothetical protein
MNHVCVAVSWVQVNFDAIVKQGTNRNKTVFTKLSDMKVRRPIGSTHIHPFLGIRSSRRLPPCFSSFPPSLPFFSFSNSSPSLSQEREADEDVLAKPTAEEETEAAAKTRRALEAIIGTKVAAARPTQIAGKPVSKSEWGCGVWGVDGRRGEWGA